MSVFRVYVLRVREVLIIMHLHHTKAAKVNLYLKYENLSPPSTVKTDSDKSQVGVF